MMSKKIAGIANIGLFIAGSAIFAANFALAAELVDPMRPSYVRGSGTTRAGIVLQSTLISGKRKSAIINGRLLNVGDRIGRLRLLEIMPNEVVLQKGKRLIRLRVMPKLAKKYKTTRSEDDANKK